LDAGTYGGHLELSAFANFHRRPIKIIQPGMVYVISYEDESPSGSSANKAKGKQLLVAKGKGKRPDDSASAVSSSETPVYLVYHQWEVSPSSSLSLILTFASSSTT
jgi:hypothetical protein